MLGIHRLAGHLVSQISNLKVTKLLIKANSFDGNAKLYNFLAFYVHKKFRAKKHNNYIVDNSIESFGIVVFVSFVEWDVVLIAGDSV